jgi:phosphate-selective porin OprO and OprP
MKRSRWRTSTVLAGLLTLTSGMAGAQDKPVPASPAPAPEAPAVPEPSPSPSPSPSPTPPRPFTAGYRNGFAIQSETGDFALRITGYTHVDGRFAVGDDQSAVTNQFLLRRIRPILQGTVAQYFEFVITPDFAGGTTVLQDGYLDVRFTPKFRARVGKMKVPLGLERLQSAQSTWFVERALPNNLVPNRDVGVQFHGEVAGGVVGYQAGVFNGVADGGSGDGDTNDDKELAARVFLQPWRTKHTSPLRGLGLGFAATRGKGVGALRNYSSVSQVAVFSHLATVTASGDRTRFSPQGYFNYGPIGLLGEYVRSTHDVQKAETGRPTLSAELSHSAWSLTGSWLLTGEESSYGSVKPKNFFVPQSGKWGALQLVARFNTLTPDPDAFPVYADPTRSVREARAVGVGFNWLWNSNLKFVADYEQTRFEGGAAGGARRPDEKSFQTRLHLSF